MFVQFFLFGAAAFAVYDLLRIFRRMFPRGRFLVALEDVGYWTAAALLFFVRLCAENSGRQRGYIWLACVCGAAVYYRFCSRPLMRRLSAGILRLKKRLQNLQKAVTINTIRKRKEAGKETCVQREKNAAAPVRPRLR